MQLIPVRSPPTRWSCLVYLTTPGRQYTSGAADEQSGAWSLLSLAPSTCFVLAPQPRVRSPAMAAVSVPIRNRLGPTPCASATPRARASPGGPRRPVCVDTMSGSTVRRFSGLKNLPELDDGRRAPRPYPSALTLDEPDQRTPLAIGRAPILPDFRANSGNATRFGRAESACPRSAVLARRGCQPCLSRAVRVHDEDLIERGAGPARTRTERHEITPPRPSS